MEQSGRENVVAHKHTHLVVIDSVDRSLAASFAAFIDHIVVHQRRRVQQLQTYGCMLGYLGRWQMLMGPSYGQYGTHVDGAGQGGIFVHSVACGSPNSYNLPAAQYNKLGSPASHGCIRACVADAKWVYENCGGSYIYIYDGTYTANESMKGPLGRKALVPLRYPYNFDPTDPAV